MDEKFISLSDDETKKLWEALTTSNGIEALSEKEKWELQRVLLEQLRRVNVFLRSDWHVGMEALLRIDAHKARNGTVVVDAEYRLGVEPPRADFIIWLQDEGTKLRNVSLKALMLSAYRITCLTTDMHSAGIKVKLLSQVSS